MAMAMQAAGLLPSCSHSQRSSLSPAVGAASQSQSISSVECRGQRASWQGMRVRIGAPLGSSLGAGWQSSSSSSSSRSNGGVARAEQAEVATTRTTTEAETKKGGVAEVDKDTFWPIVESAGDKVVVLDMYTQWCGPCKIMLPKVIELSEKLDDVIFLKLDCNQHNKSLAKELGIRVVPTFKIFKHKELAGEVTGAKFPELVKAIDKVRNGEKIK